MGVMGVEESDLIDGSDIAGAAAFLDYAAEADVSLFV
jgi:peroxiredoxin family protein